MAGNESWRRQQELREDLGGTETREQRLRALKALVAVAPEDADAHCKYARELSRTGKDDVEAMKEFWAALGAAPEHTEARLGLGVLHHRQGEYELAEAMYTSALDANPRLIRAWLNLGALAIRRKDHPEAARAYQRAVKLRSRDVTARQGLARSLQALGRLPNALAEWEEALALDEDDPTTLRGMAKALGATRDPRAHEFYERAIAANPESVSLRLECSRLLREAGDVSGAEEGLWQGVGANPKSVRLWQALSEFLTAEGRPEDSLQALRDGMVQTAGDERVRMALVRRLCEFERLGEAARELRPIILSDPRNGEARRLMAAIHACEGRYDEAASTANAALRVQPAVPCARLLLMEVASRPAHPMSVPIEEDPKVLPTHRAYALAVRGILHLTLGNPQRAAALLDQAVQASPETAVPRVGRALAYMSAESAEPAYAELRTAAILQPENPHVQHLFGEAAFHTGRFEEASEAFETALADQSVDEPLRALTCFCRARAYRKRGMTKEAIESYLQAERLDPEYAPPFFGCGVALQEQGRLEEALRHYERSVALSPRHARALLGMASCLDALGRAPEAVEAYRAAIAADPDYALPRYNLAALLERAGDPLEVAALLRGYLKREPGGPQAEDARRRLHLAELRASGALASAEPFPEGGDAPFIDSAQEGAILDAGVARTPIDP